MVPTTAPRTHRRFGGRWLLLSGLALAAVAAVLMLGDSDARGPTGIDRVLQDLEDQVRARPQDPAGRLAVAAAYAQRGRYAEALEQYEQVLILKPDHQTALMGIGRIHLDEGRLDEAFEPLQRVAEINAENPMRYTIEELEAVYYDLARIHVHRGEFEQARGRLDEALQINRTDADALRLLGNVYAELGDAEAAEQTLREAIRLVPDFVEAYEDLGRIYAAAGREGGRLFAEGMIKLASGSHEASIDRLTRAVSIEPELADAHQGLGMAYESTGQLEQALASYERAAELDPNLFLSVSAVARLQAKAGAQEGRQE